MINGTLTTCDMCGGDVELPRDLLDAHHNRNTDADVYPYHVVWQHAPCGRSSETPVTRRTFQAAVDYSRLAQGKISEDERTVSEDEETLSEFAVELFQFRTLADTGWAEVSNE